MADSGFTIRRGELRDADFLVRAAADMMEETEGRDVERELVYSGVNRILSNEQLGFYLLAESEGVLVGSSLITPFWLDLADGFYWWMSCVYVVPDARRAGVFRALYEHLRKLAESDKHARGIRLCVHKENLPACKAYETMGMQALPYRMFQEKC